jgi:hypothetical protein
LMLAMQESSTQSGTQAIRILPDNLSICWRLPVP